MKKLLTIILLLTLCFVFKIYGKQENKAKKKISKENMILIPAGEFIMGSNERDDEKPIHKIYLDTYYIDKFEVTNAQYKQCVAAKKCTPPQDSTINTTNYNNSSYTNHPVIYVDWEQANTYCKSVSKQLPTEAQWEKAARGTQGYTYPWGNDWDCNKSCNSVSPCKNGTTCKIGSFSAGASSYGVMDMSGNVYEWVSDWYDDNYYNNSPSSNPTGASSGTYRVVRGGSWYNGNTTNFRSAFRYNYYPYDRSLVIGFRCSVMGS